MINWKVRFKNPVFLFQLVLSILTPILAYVGLTFEDITSWYKLFDLIIMAVSNPYILALVVINVWNAITDPTTKGIKDNDRVMKYDKPN